MASDSSIPSLTTNAIQRILNGETVDKPVLQILAYKKVAGDGKSQTRVRFIMSDGVKSHQCCVMIGDQLIQRVERGEFERYSVIRLDEYAWNDIKENKVLVMKNPVLLKKGELVARKIGTPDNAGGGPPGKSVVSDAGISSDGASPVRPPAKRPAGSSAAPSFSNGSASKTKKPGTVVIPIHAVNQFQRGLSVKGRVTTKSAMRTWANEKGSGCLFSFDLQDETSEIRVTAFKEQAEKLFKTVQMGQVYVVSRPVVKTANKKFSNLPHEYELTVADDTDVTAGDENDLSCPQMQYSFVPLKEIANCEPNTFIDVAAVIHRVADVATIVAKATQKELKKREITLVDDTQAEIALSVWGKEAEDFAGEVGSPVILKKAKVSDFSGRSLSASTGFSMQLDPNHPEAHRLKQWYEETKNELQLTSLTTAFSRETPFKLLFQVIHEVTHSEAPVFAQVRVTFVHMMKTSQYDACPTDKCKKRVMDMNNGSFRCEKCNKDFDNPQKRFIQNVRIADATGDLYISAFHEEFLKMVNMTNLTGDELEQLNDAAWLEARVAEAGCKQFVLKLKVFRDTYNEQLRTKAVVMELKPVDYAVQARRLLANCRALLSP